MSGPENNTPSSHGGQIERQSGQESVQDTSRGTAEPVAGSPIAESPVAEPPIAEFPVAESPIAEFMDDQVLDQTLEHLGAPCDPPGLCSELEAKLDGLQPVRTRSRGFAFGLIGGVSLLYCAAMVLFMDLRPDFDGLPRNWFILYTVAWLLSFVAIAYFALVPRAGQVAPNWRTAGIAAVVASFAFVIGGLLFGRAAPAVSAEGAESAAGNLDNGLACLSVGSVSALLPILLGALLLRGRLPVGSQWAGAGLGAAGGSLGGLLLHLHCEFADPIHLGLAHGGVVVLGAIIGAVLLPRTSS